ncbi:MAG: hypothetical protein HFE39_07040 [Clostridiales bacterium]|nr:hypothetical protein [Clostridiales bacterium]
MKKSNILRQLYLGKIQPEERFPINQRYRRALKTSILLEEKLSNQLSKEQKKLLSQLLYMEDCLIKEEAFIRFQQGIRLGARLIHDLF